MNESICKTTVPVALAQLTDDESSRYDLNCVRILPTKTGVLCIACNGRAAAIVPRDGEASRPTLLPGDILERAKARGGAVGVTLTNEWRTANEFASESDGNFPRLTEILPTIDGNWHCLSFDAKFLATIADAIQGDDYEGQVSLMFHPAYPTKILAVVARNGIGVVMPLNKPPVENPRETFNQAVATVAKAEGEKPVVQTADSMCRL